MVYKVYFDTDKIYVIASNVTDYELDDSGSIPSHLFQTIARTTWTLIKQAQQTLPM
jgi:hypothetical protein